jgi:hypothetical protein
VRAIIFMMAQRAAIGPDARLFIDGILDDYVAIVPSHIPADTEVAVHWPDCLVVAYLECRLADGLTHTIALRVLNEDERRVAPDTAPTTITFAPTPTGRPMRMPLVIGFDSIPLDCPGDYSLVLLIDGQPAAAYPFYTSRN